MCADKSLYLEQNLLGLKSTPGLRFYSLGHLGGERNILWGMEHDVKASSHLPLLPMLLVLVYAGQIRSLEERKQFQVMCVKKWFSLSLQQQNPSVNPPPPSGWVLTLKETLDESLHRSPR